MSDQPSPPLTTPKRFVPQSEIDMTMLTTDPAWGSQHANPALISRLERYEVGKDALGNDVETKRDLWGRLSIFQRDMRLANLSANNGELEYVRWALDMAQLCLQHDMTQSAAIALGLAATVLETSQSKGGFLRKRMNTLTNEQIHSELEPAKKGLLGVKGGGH